MLLSLEYEALVLLEDSTPTALEDHLTLIGALAVRLSSGWPSLPEEVREHVQSHIDAAAASAGV